MAAVEARRGFGLRVGAGRDAAVFQALKPATTSCCRFHLFGTPKLVNELLSRGVSRRLLSP